MDQISYRLALPSEWKDIALLHARSWQEHYRGICSDDYLDNKVEEDRLSVWSERFQKDDPKMHVLAAVNQSDQIIGFVCTFLDYHKEWGAYLDNLHVSSDFQKRGIGVKLMRRAAAWVREQRPDSQIYLHVLKENAPAIKFYERINGKRVGEYEIDLPWGGSGVVYDYLWKLEELK